MHLEELKTELKRPSLNVLLLVESGSQIFGWNGPDSDEDVRGVYLDPFEKAMALHPGKDCIVENPTDKIWDLQLFELKKYLGQLIKPNFSMIEWANSAIRYHAAPGFREEVLEIAQECICRKLGSHARGWSYSMHKMDWGDPKKCLMALRPLMVYNNLLETGVWESNIRVLSKSADNNLQKLIDSLLEARMASEKTSTSLKIWTGNQHDDLKARSYVLEDMKELRKTPTKRAYELANNMLLRMRAQSISH